MHKEINTPLPLDLLTQLNSLLGNRFTMSTGICREHGTNESWHSEQPPQAVVFPISTDEVSNIVSLCTERKIPLIPYGAGTSLEAQTAAPKGGMCLDMSRMNKIVSINNNDLDVTVEAGVTRNQLNSYLHDVGLFFPVDPGADATLGGMAATRASGTTTVRYGAMVQNVLGLTVVMSGGEIVKTGTRARKSAAGYDLTRLFIGSEGTLGVITELSLRLYGIPEGIASAIVSFATLDGAIASVILALQSGIPVARIELLDELMMKAVNKFSDLNYPEKPTLFLEFHGSQASVKEQAENFGAICCENGGTEIQWATLTEDRNKLWRARHEAAYAAKQLRPGSDILATDVCVPISNLCNCIMETKRDVEATGLCAPLVGHVGDGNFHLVILVDSKNDLEMEMTKSFCERLVNRAIGMGGTCTGEHGVGLGKKSYMALEHGKGVEVMAAIKRALDPNNIFNPGKVFES